MWSTNKNYWDLSIYLDHAMLDKWLLNIALKGILECHKKVFVLWQRLIDIFTVLNVAPASFIHWVMEDGNASNVGSDLLLDHGNASCQNI